MLISLIFIPLISADLIVPYVFRIVPIIPFIILAEIIIFWLVINKLFKFSLGWGKTILVVLVANVVSTIFGFFLPDIGDFTTITLISFILSIFIEWGSLFLFFMKEEWRGKQLLLASLIINIVSYLGILIIYWLKI